jgi:hypothetical protein
VRPYLKRKEKVKKKKKNQTTNKKPKQNNLKEESFIFAHSSRDFFPLCRKAMAEQSNSPSGGQEAELVMLLGFLFSPFIPTKSPVYGMVPPTTFRVVLPSATHS